jgi:membrane fusion protein, adhesin transport system
MILDRLGIVLLNRISGGSMTKHANPEEVSAAFAGQSAISATPVDGVTPWSARVRTAHSSRTLWLLGGLLTLFLLWASLFHIDKVTRGNGRVLPSVQNQIVQHLEGGIVSQLLVQEGQRVTKGQVLLRISNQFTSADFENAQTDVTAKRIALARMDAEVSGARSFKVPEELASLAPDIARSEEALFYSRVSQLGNETGIMAEQARGRRAEIGSLNARLGNLRSQERLMMDQLDKLERAYAAEAISEREVLDKRANLLELRTRIADVQNQIPQTSAALSEVSVRSSEIRSRQMEETKTKAAQLRLELSKAGEALGAFKDKQAREEIRAPMSGIVNKLYVQTVGGVIRAGEPIAEIVPIDKTIMVEARIPPRDRGDVWPGLPASVKISAYDSAIYGGLEAKVEDVSADVLQDPKGDVYYRVRLRADTGGFGAGKPVIPGMTAEVNIRSGSQTVLDYMLGPVINLRDNALREQ